MGSRTICPKSTGGSAPYRRPNIGMSSSPLCLYLKGSQITIKPCHLLVHFIELLRCNKVKWKINGGCTLSSLNLGGKVLRRSRGREVSGICLTAPWYFRRQRQTLWLWHNCSFGTIQQDKSHTPGVGVGTTRAEPTGPVGRSDCRSGSTICAYWDDMTAIYAVKVIDKCNVIDWKMQW